MIWSVFKILVFVALAGAMTYGASLLMETSGGVQIAFGGQEWTLTPLVAVILFVATLIGAWIVLKLIGMVIAVMRYLSGDETALSRYFDRGRERKGFDALTQSLLALASGDAKRAQSQALHAEKLLNRPELTRLLNAQALEAGGNSDRAALYYKEMLTDDKSRFVGVLGLMRQKLAAGDTDTALKLAEKAFALQPRHGDTLNTLFKLQSDREDWSGARATLKAKVSAATLPRDVGKRREAILLLADARTALADDNGAKAREAAFQANRLAPGLVPAAALAAELHTKDGQTRKAARIIKRAWSVLPHPDLAAAFASIVPDETPGDRQRRFRPLLSQTATQSESRLVAAELALAAEDFPSARRALGNLAELSPTTRSLALMAAIERGQGSPDAVVRGWLAKALNAARGEAWTCESCHHVHGGWSPTCDHCGAFDTLAWLPQPNPEETAHSAGMLPLIVGALERPTDDGMEDPDPAPANDENIAEAPAEPEISTPSETDAEANQAPIEATEEIRPTGT